MSLARFDGLPPHGLRMAMSEGLFVRVSARNHLVRARLLRLTFCNSISNSSLISALMPSFPPKNSSENAPVVKFFTPVTPFATPEMPAFRTSMPDFLEATLEYPADEGASLAYFNRSFCSTSFRSLLFCRPASRAVL